MNEPKREFWFPVKQYGFGWGPPVKWQGWIVLVLYLLSILAIGVRFRPKEHLESFLIYVFLATGLLVGICFLKGERPLAWRWNKKPNRTKES